MLTINIVTIFPEFFRGPLGLSIPARAAEAGGVRYNLVDLRGFTHDRHRSVDDYPFGGGPGMVMRPGPFFEAVESLGATSPIVLLSPRGRRFAHADAMRFAEGSELTLLCGHYKDIDERVATHLATEELSLGDFVLSGGEPAALAIVDATVRLLPGAMSDLDSARTDSFFDRGISAPSYTRPAEFRGFRVPEVLLGGDHAKVAAWREAESVRRTREAEARDRAEWQVREARIAEREAALAVIEQDAAKKAAEKARRAAAKARKAAREARRNEPGAPT
ncbi:MAG: tRNA (guanosine(37)-N1)-methyltransferase TrmD [Gemmatimonas sp.]|nr:tRNA (guanosine(37)-N1)-methyltransferase TrmD [Gemmatimonas sp.]